MKLAIWSRMKADLGSVEEPLLGAAAAHISHFPISILHPHPSPPSPSDSRLGTIISGDRGQPLDYTNLSHHDSD